jgi:hypothetical protein
MAAVAVRRPGEEPFVRRIGRTDGVADVVIS